jgi:hypothetical protein
MVHAWQQTKISQNTPQGVKNVVNKAAPYVAAYYAGRHAEQNPVSDDATADKKRRAQMLANSRKGTIKTSPLGLPGGGFAQKQLLGA